MSQPTSSATSSGHYYLSPSFEAAIAQIVLPQDAAKVEDGVNEEQRPLKKRRVAFREDAEEIKSHVEEEGAASQEGALEESSDAHSLPPDEADDAELHDDDNEGLPRLASSYLDDQAYNASKFGGFAEYFKHRRIKLQNQNRAIAEERSHGKPQIFKGLELYINGHVQPSLQVLREMIMEHGGTYIPYLVSELGVHAG